MKPNTPGFIGERLVQARKSIGLSGVGLAGLLDVSATTISQYEKNKQSPRPEIMDALCEKLNLPKSFFLRPIADRGERKVLYRSLSAATKAARERAETRFEWGREIVEYLHDSFDFPKLNLPNLNLPKDFNAITHQMIEDAAMACRELWGFGDKPISDVVLALESNGIIVMRGELGAETLDAFSEWLANDFAYIFLGSDKRNCARSRFDAAHELGHLILHKHISIKDIKSPKEFKVIESQAHRFAASFLLPARSFIKSIWAPTLDAFRTQKEVWRVSIKGMIVRSHQLDLIDDYQYQRMLINYTRRYRDGEPGDDVMPLEMPRLLSRCIEILLAEKIRTKEQILMDLALPARDVEELTSLPRGFFSGFKAEVIEMPVLRRRAAEEALQKGEDVGETNNVVEFKIKGMGSTKVM